MKLRYKMAFLVGCLTILLLTSGCVWGAKTQLTPGKSSIEKIEETKNPTGYKTRTTNIKIHIPGENVKSRNTTTIIEDSSYIDILNPPKDCLMFVDLDPYQLTEQSQLMMSKPVKQENTIEIPKDYLEPVKLPGGQEIGVPPGATVEVIIEEREPSGGYTRKTNKAIAKGPGLTTTAENIDWSAFKVNSPTADMNGTHAESGAIDYAAKGLKVNSGPIILYAIGGICILAGIIIIAFIKRVALGLTIAAGGVAIIAVATLFQNYPWVVLIAFGIGVAYAIYLIIAARKTKRLQETLTTVVAGVENTPEPNAEQVKEAIQKEAEDRNVKDVVKSVVSKIKKTI